MKQFEEEKELERLEEANEIPNDYRMRQKLNERRTNRLETTYGYKQNDDLDLTEKLRVFSHEAEDYNQKLSLDTKVTGRTSEIGRKLSHSRNLDGDVVIYELNEPYPEDGQSCMNSGQLVP